MSITSNFSDKKNATNVKIVDATAPAKSQDLHNEITEKALSGAPSQTNKAKTSHKRAKTISDVMASPKTNTPKDKSEIETSNDVFYTPQTTEGTINFSQEFNTVTNSWADPNNIGEAIKYNIDGEGDESNSQTVAQNPSSGTKNPPSQDGGVASNAQLASKLPIFTVPSTLTMCDTPQYVAIHRVYKRARDMLEQLSNGNLSVEQFSIPIIEAAEAFVKLGSNIIGKNSESIKLLAYYAHNFKLESEKGEVQLAKTLNVFAKAGEAQLGQTNQTSQVNKLEQIIANKNDELLATRTTGQALMSEIDKLTSINKALDLKNKSLNIELMDHMEVNAMLDNPNEVLGRGNVTGNKKPKNKRKNKKQASTTESASADNNNVKNKRGRSDTEDSTDDEDSNKKQKTIAFEYTNSTLENLVGNLMDLTEGQVVPDESQFPALSQDHINNTVGDTPLDTPYVASGGTQTATNKQIRNETNVQMPPTQTEVAPDTNIKKGPYHLKRFNPIFVKQVNSLIKTKPENTVVVAFFGIGCTVLNNSAEFEDTLGKISKMHCKHETCSCIHFYKTRNFLDGNIMCRSVVMIKDPALMNLFQETFSQKGVVGRECLTTDWDTKHLPPKPVKENIIKNKDNNKIVGPPIKVFIKKLPVLPNENGAMLLEQIKIYLPETETARRAFLLNGKPTETVIVTLKRNNANIGKLCDLEQQGGIRIGLCIRPIEKERKFVPKYVQCFRCLVIGHNGNNCKAPTPRCFRCSKGHLTREHVKEDGEKPQCSNCGENHRATDITNCRVLQIAEQKARAGNGNVNNKPQQIQNFDKFYKTNFNNRNIRTTKNNNNNRGNNNNNNNNNTNINNQRNIPGLNYRNFRVGSQQKKSRPPTQNNNNNNKTQIGPQTPRNINQVKCYNCKKLGHLGQNCYNPVVIINAPINTPINKTNRAGDKRRSNQSNYKESQPKKVNYNQINKEVESIRNSFNRKLDSTIINFQGMN